MIGMDLLSFLILLVIGIVVAAILHYGFRFYVIPGASSFLGKVVIGWLGAWLGSPVFGHWLEGLRYESVYYIPAVLGSLALVLLAVDVAKSVSTGIPAAPAAEAPSSPSVADTPPETA